MTEEATTDNRAKVQHNFLTTTQLAKLCGVSRFTILSWVKQGKVGAIKTVGGQYRIARSEAVSFYETLRV